jgi:hypothetical protein
MPLMHTAIVGPMHSGKTTLAKALVKHGYTRMAFADPLKDSAASMLNRFILAWLPHLPPRQDHMYGRAPLAITVDRQEIEDHKEVFRPFLQWLGTEFGREYCGNDNLWIDIFSGRVKDHGWSGPIVCDDVRFPNEADALRELGFRIIRIIRPEEDRLASLSKQRGLRQSSHRENERIPGNASMAHASETQIGDINVDEERMCLTLAHIEDWAADLARRGVIA